MLYLILADTELETVPELMTNESDVINHARRKRKDVGQLVLDSSFMHRSIEKYYPGESNRRGRPDLVHTFLMVTQESILNRKGMLRTYIHTRNDQVIDINPEERFPKSYNRFVGLIEDLLASGLVAAEGRILLSVKRETLLGLINKIRCRNIRVLSPRASITRITEVVRDGSDLVVVIGGFAFGDYKSDISTLGEALSIYEEELTTWTVASEIISQFERTLSILT